jgi:redox-sensitive bicupin YhaK (pirin superfamily)
LDSRHTFSFGSYHDRRFMGFGPLRVINEDRVQPGQGFGTHSHRDMEIISYVLDGALEHRDSLGTGSVIRPGDVQRMSAGTGVSHSEFNQSSTEIVHFLQIWIIPDTEGLPPSYEQKSFSREERRDRWCLVAAPDGSDGAVRVHQNVRLYTALLDPGRALRHEIDPGRSAWLQVARGEVAIAGLELAAGDGVAIQSLDHLELKAATDAELLLFDLPGEDNHG